MLEHYEKGWKDRDYIAEVQKERGITKTQAVKWLRERIPPEKYFQKKILDARILCALSGDGILGLR